MTQRTSIEWTDVSWNPIRGCSRVSAGCDHCYAERIAARFSGPGARPMHPDWPRSIRDQCIAAGVPFFFKQWGEWCPTDQWSPGGGSGIDQSRESDRYHQFADGTVRGVLRLGKKRAGRLLDGREWKEFPHG